MLLGCGKPRATYTVGGVYSIEVMDIPRLYGLQKVIAITPDAVIIHAAPELVFEQQRPTSATAFPADRGETVEALSYVRVSLDAFERRKPQLVGVLPLTETEKQKALERR